MDCKEKICSKCKKLKALSLFGKDKNNKQYGLKSRCKGCESIATRAYQLKNLEKVRAYDKQYRIKNKEQLLLKAKEYSKRYYKLKDKTKIREYQRNYRLKHKDKVQEYFRNYHLKRGNIDFSFRLLKNLRSRLYNALKGKNKSKKILNLIGCSIQELIKYLEVQFVNGMSWDNYGKWHVDHRIPCSSFDLTKEAEQLKCFHFSNLQPLWAIDNLRKSDII